jgi:hypothetical protein
MINFHDLRHNGDQLADVGANLRELMDRMEHSTTRAAMAYLHGSDGRQQAIADELSRQTAASIRGRSPGRSDASGTLNFCKLACADGSIASTRSLVA